MTASSFREWWEDRNFSNEGGGCLGETIWNASVRSFLSKVESKINEAEAEQTAFIASEKLGGNIVKEEFHKGALFGLRVAMIIIDEERPPCRK